MKLKKLVNILLKKNWHIAQKRVEYTCPNEGHTRPLYLFHYGYDFSKPEYFEFINNDSRHRILTDWKWNRSKQLPSFMKRLFKSLNISLPKDLAIFH